MKYFNAIISTLNLCTIFVFWYRFTAPVVDAISTFAPSEGALAVFLAAQANHQSLLQIYLILVSILIALLAYWGYNGIRRGAEEKAEKVAKSLVPGLVKQYLDELGPADLAQKFVEEKMNNPSDVDSKRAFTDDIKDMQDDPYELLSIQ